MERTKRITRGAGKVMLALLAGILFPILIWVALGVALYHKERERAAQRQPAPTIGEILNAAGLSIQAEANTDRMLAAKAFTQQPVTKINKLMAKSGLTVKDQAAPKHCWEILDCPPEQRQNCPNYMQRALPSWVAIGLGKCGQENGVCVNGTLLDTKKLQTQA